MKRLTEIKDNSYIPKKESSSKECVERLGLIEDILEK